MDYEKKLTEKFNKYLALTSLALKKAKKFINKKNKKEAEIIFDMVSRYLEDAKYFYNKKMLAEALSACSYAHGWLDCGNRLGIFNVQDNKLFITK